MTNRRTILKTGLISINLPLLSASFIRSDDRLLQNLKFNDVTIIYDSKFYESLRFEEKFRDGAIDSKDIKGGVAHLWYKDLKTKITRKNSTLIGLTRSLDLFCLEELARDLGMKVDFRFDHTPIDDLGSLNNSDNYNNFEINDWHQKYSFLYENGHSSTLNLALINYNLRTPIHKRPAPISLKGQNSLVTWLIS